MSHYPAKKKSRSGSGSGSGSGSRSDPPSRAKSGSKPGSKPSSKGSNPDDWCEWERDEQWPREWRSRQNPDGQWEYQYRGVDGEDVPRTQNVGGGNNLDRIEEDDPPDDQDYRISNSPQNRGQLSTSSRALRASPLNVDAAQGYAFNLSSSLDAPLNTAVGNLRLDSGAPQDDMLGYEGRSSSIADDERAAIQPLPGSMQEAAKYYAPSAAEGATYPMAPPARPLQPFPSPYAQPGPTNYPSLGYASEETSNQPLSRYAMNPGSVESVQSVRHISASSPREVLHKDFKLHLAKDFKFGRVFKILWTEPKGQGMPTKGTDKPEGVTYPTTYGEDVYTSIRRFVISKVKDGHCLCLPILTYQGQATTKRGVKAQDHAIIYTGEKGQKTKPPKEIENEEKLRKKAIRITPNSAREQLDKLSRLNYAKIYTVEFNVKVHFVGNIHDRSVKYFIRDYNAMHQPLPQASDVVYSEEENSDEH